MKAITKDKSLYKIRKRTWTKASVSFFVAVRRQSERAYAVKQTYEVKQTYAVKQKRKGEQEYE